MYSNGGASRQFRIFYFYTRRLELGATRARYGLKTTYYHRREHDGHGIPILVRYTILFRTWALICSIIYLAAFRTILSSLLLALYGEQVQQLFATLSMFLRKIDSMASLKIDF